MCETSKIIGIRIKTERVKQELSQEQLAELANTHGNYIGEIERGVKNPTINAVSKIAEALKLPLEKLFKGL